MNMENVNEMNVYDRMIFQNWASMNLEFLVRSGAEAELILERNPNDFVAMSTLKKIQSDIMILTPLMEAAQKANCKHVEKLTGKKFAYLVNRDDLIISKDNSNGEMPPPARSKKPSK